MILVRFAFLLLFSAVPAAADIVVEAGEHADFSRLVLQLPEGGDWEFGRVAGGYELRLARPQGKMDTSRVFEKIPRTRILSISEPGPGRVLIETSCACHADAFEIRSGRVVLDIKTGAAPPKASFERALPDLETEQPKTAGHEVAAPMTAKADELTTTVTRVASSEYAALPGTRPSSEPSVSLSPRFSLDEQILPFLGVDTAEPEKRAVEEDHPLEVMEEAFLRQLGRAASQGLIDVTPPAASTIAVPEDPQASVSDMISEDERPQEAESSPSDHLYMETALDRAAPDIGNRNMTLTGQACLSGEAFDVASWGSPPEGPNMGFNRAVLGEFDQPKATEITALARHYIYLGFGAEAAALVSSYPDITKQDWILGELAAIVDDPGSNRASPLRDQLGCDTPAALWAVLVRPADTFGDPARPATVLQTFSGLPIHLREQLGPALATKFLDAGDAATATSIRNMIARSPGSSASKIALLEAEIETGLGKNDIAVAELRRIVRTGGADTPTALAQLIDLQIAAGQMVDPQMADLASIFAFENRGTELGGRLERAAINGLISLTRIDEAFDAIARTAKLGFLSEEEASRFAALAHSRNAKDASDTDFLRTLWSQGMPADAENADVTAARHAIAARLLALGFAEEVGNLLLTSGGPPDGAARLQLAEAALLRRRGEVALTFLVGMDDDDALALTARALEAMGQSAEAADLYQRTGQEAEAGRLAWIAGDGQRIMEHGNTIQKEAATKFRRLASGPQPAEADIGEGISETVLADGRNLVEKSAERRRLVAALLDEDA